MPVEPVQTKRDIEGLLAAVGTRPQKRLGQHFLIDGNLMRRLVRCARLNAQDLALEVGGGTGGLSDLLVRRGARVICVEVDRKLQGVLAERFAKVENFTLLCGDVLERKHRIRADLARMLGEYSPGLGGGVKLVANLPYQVATPLLMNLLVDYPQVRRFCFTVQAEVGARITAAVGGKEYGPLSILSQLLCRATLEARIPPQAFWPRPAVDSVMIRLEVRDSPLADVAELRAFANLVRGVFGHRRKTLGTALRYVVDGGARERVCQTFDAGRRPESFGVEDWVGICRAAGAPA